MQYKRLGNTGLKVSRICLGTMGFGDESFKWVKTVGQEESTKIIAAAWKAGINFFDTGHFYSNGKSEEILGHAIKELGIPRDEIVIASKVFLPVTKEVKLGSIGVNAHGLSRKILFSYVNDALKRLQTDYIDLYNIARWDPTTPIEETMKALHDLVQAGKIRYIGASTMYAWQFAKAQQVAIKNGWTCFVAMQNLYNVVYREEEREMIPMCVDMGVGITPWAPLAHGWLVNPEPPKDEGMMKGWYDEHSRAILDQVTRIAKEKKISNSEVALAWLLHQEAVTSPIVGTTSVKNLESAIRSLNVKLTKEDIDALQAPYKPKKFLGLFEGAH